MYPARQSGKVLVESADDNPTVPLCSPPMEQYEVAPIVCQQNTLVAGCESQYVSIWYGLVRISGLKGREYVVAE